MNELNGGTGTRTAEQAKVVVSRAETNDVNVGCGVGWVCAVANGGMVEEGGGRWEGRGKEGKEEKEKKKKKEENEAREESAGGCEKEEERSRQRRAR